MIRQLQLHKLYLKKFQGIHDCINLNFQWDSQINLCWFQFLFFKLDELITVNILNKNRFFLFNGILTFMDYLMLKPFLLKKNSDNI